MFPLDLKDGTIDAGLYLLDLVRDPQRVYSQSEIAIACGCTAANIAYIEHRAMEKIAAEFQKRAGQFIPEKPQPQQSRKLKIVAPIVPFHNMQFIPASYKTKNYEPT